MTERVPTYYTRHQVSLHNTKSDCWIIVRGNVYDVTSWVDDHPGGSKVICNHAGEDATIPFETFHVTRRAYNQLGKFRIGELVPEEKQLSEIQQDFLKLKETLKQKGLFEPNYVYYPSLILLGLSSEVIGIGLLMCYPKSWLVWILAALCAFYCGAIMQELGHDLGHCSGFKSVRVNRWVQNFCFTFIGGQCSSFWNKRHNEHHTKPNLVPKDPDVSFPYNIVLLGSEIPKEVGSKGEGILPYQYQGIYLSIIFPTILLTVGFNIMATVYLIKNISKKWKELILFCLFFVRWYFLYSYIFGNAWSAIGFYCLVKIIQGLWLALVTQSHHLSREISATDKGESFLAMQVNHCYNLTANWFVNRGMAHTGYHIEHHLFPSMPTHNHHLAKPYVMQLCQKHGIQYREVSAWSAISSIPGELRHAGEIWLEEYTKSS